MEFFIYQTGVQKLIIFNYLFTEHIWFQRDVLLEDR